MHNNKVCILSTAPLEPSLLEKAMVNGMDVDVQPFITISELPALELEAQMERLFAEKATVVFTSANAVRSVVRFKGSTHPDWNIYCIGSATAKLVTDHFSSSAIVGTAGNASDLAELIVRLGAKDIVFFCGNIRRNELLDKLTQAGISVREVIVYNTIPIPHKIEKNYDAIMFFSPSAVASFFNDNIVGPHTVLFAIGNTTASEIRRFTGNRLIVSNEPDKNQMLDQLITTFQNQSITR